MQSNTTTSDAKHIMITLLGVRGADALGMSGSLSAELPESAMPQLQEIKKKNYRFQNIHHHKPHTKRFVITIRVTMNNLSQPNLKLSSLGLEATELNYRESGSSKFTENPQLHFQLSVHNKSSKFGETSININMLT